MKTVKVIAVANTEIKVSFEDGHMAAEYIPYEKETVKGIPTLEEVKSKYSIGTKFKSIIYENQIKERRNGSIYYEGNCWYVTSMDGAARVWSYEDGWAEIIKPLFTNSHGSKFYDKSEYASYVNKEENLIYTRRLLDIMNDLSDSNLYTEIMTQSEAEQYILDHRIQR